MRLRRSQNGASRFETPAKLRPRIPGRLRHKLDGAAVLGAIAVFECSLVTPDSLFDHWLQGDSAAPSADALDGYRRYKAVSCAS